MAKKKQTPAETTNGGGKAKAPDAGDYGAVSRGVFTAARRLYKTVDGKIVDEGDKDALTLLAHEGQEFPLAKAQELGLVAAD
jgi:hypothetical protein